MNSDAVQSAFGRIRSGESKGQEREMDWETVYRAVWPVLVARVSRRGPSQLAADAVQSALLSILSTPGRMSLLATIDDFVAYTSRVATNKVIDVTRQLLRLYPLAELDPVDPRSDWKDDPVFLYAPKQLSSDEVDLMRMFYVEGRTYSEIANLCKTTERAIRTRMFRLQRELARVLRPKEKSP
jgi:RNA polymerase sigma factor (sigma-70 family)